MRTSIGRPHDRVDLGIVAGARIGRDDGRRDGDGEEGGDEGGEEGGQVGEDRGEEGKGAPTAKTSKKVAKAAKSAKRELVEPTPGDKRYVRRDDGGAFKEVDDVSRSLAQDVRKKAKKVAKSGQGDRGDRKRS